MACELCNALQSVANWISMSDQTMCNRKINTAKIEQKQKTTRNYKITKDKLQWNIEQFIVAFKRIEIETVLLK